MAAAVVALVLGSVLGFGGAVWWFRPAFAACSLPAGPTVLLRLLQGRMPIFKSPLTLLGFLPLALGFLQLAPLPSPWLGSSRRPRNRFIRMV